eukprot:CAMPEP_0119044628 /NCGR_PEP_ID=MMETSP1177-20130426/33086_1 /TAXON_ID=2985 /ORGANISM="Ochromonas sp, Strain CCMP1899" /LENGTH=412 /DNA_ID=CAMNT_0007015033 /DNA_START=346 /DNA_END=1581 /DNA_ORIENTATION=+
MVVQFKDLAFSSVVEILTFLRAIDMVSVSEVSKSIFEKSRIRIAAKFQMDYIYILPSSPMKEKKLLQAQSEAALNSHLPLENYGIMQLYTREIKMIIAALSAPVPAKGFWISSTWVSNAKKYFEAIHLPEVEQSPKKGAKRQSKIRQRRGSDALPPWTSMNADITCAHEFLALNKGLRAKKRLIDGKDWHLLRKFYPEGIEFKSNTSEECSICHTGNDIEKATACEKRDLKIKIRQSRVLSGCLESVAARKNGVPSHLMTHKMTPVYESDWADCISSPLSTSPNTTAILPEDLSYLLTMRSTQPLLPGLYNLVPKAWLKLWRHYAKDLNVLSVPPLDCTSMLCHSHGLLVIPLHVEEYLVGLKKSLLGGLGSYEGDIVEILCLDEWDELQMSLKSLSDFSVRFCLDGDNVSW